MCGLVTLSFAHQAIKFSNKTEDSSKLFTIVIKQKPSVWVKS